MRPDEHKKKASARYRKKHGVTNDGKAASGPLSIAKDKKNPEGSPHVDEENKVESSLEKDEEAVYSRRKLRSNLDRYEETEQEETQIGQDFNELVGSAGGTSSHLILQSEKDWELEQDFDEILSIDFGKLAKSLNQLPFCERLDLDESLLEPSLVKLLHEGVALGDQCETNPLAMFSLNDYKFDFSAPTNSKETKHKHVEENEAKFHHASDKNTETCSKEKDSNNITEETTSPHGQVVSNDEIKTSPTLVHKAVVPIPHKQSTKKSSRISLAASSKQKEEEFESELESLLSGNITPVDKRDAEVKSLLVSSTSTPIEQKKTTHSPGTTVKQTEEDELEDWLDSII